MDEERIIAEVARRNGVLLHRDDPILQIHTMLEMHAADHREREERLAQRDAAFLAELSQIRQPAAVFTDGQVDNIGHRLLGSCQMWSRSLVRTSLAKSWAVMAAVVLGALVIGIGIGWWLHMPPSELACGDQADGGRICWMYTRLPTAMAAKR